MFCAPNKFPVWLLALSLLGCGDSPPPAAQAPASTAEVPFRYAMDEIPTGFDPLKAGTIYASSVVLATHDTLYRYRYLQRPYELTENLAEGPPEVSPDGLTWTIRLKPGVFFADDPAFPGGRGREVVAGDVEYSFKRHFHPANVSEGSWLWQEQLVGIEAWRSAGADYAGAWQAVVASDKHEVQFHLTRPFPQFPHTLVQAFSAVVAREAVERYGADLALHPVGSGPFVLDGFDGAVAHLRRNPRYRQEVFSASAEGFDPVQHADTDFTELDGRAPPFVERLEIHYLTDSRVNLATFQGLETDLTSLLPSQLLVADDPAKIKPEFRECCGVRLAPLSELVYMAFNFNDPDLGTSTDPARNSRNHALRCAIGKAYDWHARNRQFNAGTGQVFTGFIPPGVPGFDPQLPSDWVRADPEAARQLLSKNGWTADTLPTLRFASTGGIFMQQVFEQFRSDLVGIGWPVDKLQWESFPNFGAYNSAVNSGHLMLMDVGWRLDYPDALNTLQLFYGPYAPPQVNAGAYANPEFDRLFLAAQALPAGAERNSLTDKMNRILLDDCVAMGGFSRSTVFAWRQGVLAFPDREMLGGHFLKFVARSQRPSQISRP